MCVEDAVTPSVKWTEPILDVSSSNTLCLYCAICGKYADL